MTDLEHEPAEILPAPTVSRRSRLGLWVGIVGLMAAGVFAATNVVAPSGADSPEAAVEELFSAISNEDVLGVMASLAPSERDVLRDPLVDIVEELSRLEVLADDVKLSDLQGVELEFDDLRLSSRQLAAGISTVRLDGGRATYRVEPRKLPIGPFLSELAGEEVPAEPVEGTSPIEGAPEIVAVEEGGRWYVSLWYSLAEVMRARSGQPAPAFGNGLAPDGAEGPEEAVREMVAAATRLDLRRALQLLPPDEARVLHDYAPLFLDDAEAGLSENRPAIEVSTLELDVDRNGSSADVTVKRIGVAGAFGDDSGRFDYDGRCTTVDFGGEQQKQCADEGGAFPTDLRVKVVERGGQWYVSPIRSLLAPIVEALRSLDRGDLDQLRERLGSLFGAGFSAESSAEIETIIGGEVES